MTYNEILSSIREQIHDISVLKNDDFYCYVRDDNALREIYAIIENFKGDITEFTVCFVEENTNFSKYTTYDSVDRFIKDFKDIKEDFGKLEKLKGSVLFL